MANIDDPTGTQPAVDPAGVNPVIPDPHPSVDPERYAALEQYYQRTNPLLEQYKDDFNAIIEDEGYREFQRSPRESNYEMKKRQEAAREAEIPESEKRLLPALNELLGKFKPVLDEYDNRTKAQERAKAEESEKFTRENMEYAQRLVSA